jgi:hypothetical protein
MGKYLDRNGEEIKEGFYKEGEIILQIRYISQDGKGGWQCENPDSHIFKLDPNLSKHNFTPISGGITGAGEFCYELFKKAKWMKSILEQLAQSEQSPSEEPFHHPSAHLNDPGFYDDREPGE